MGQKGIIRTPDHYFKNLPGYPFPPNYFEYDGMRVHYLDAGDDQSVETILCLHGEPSWVYLYRKMIPPLAADFRVLAMDFVGFGRSDKLLEKDDYSFDLHLNTLKLFIQNLNPDKVTLVVHDWGGLIGLAMVGEMPERFARLVIMNTGLTTGDVPMPEAFLRWRQFAERLSTRIPIGRVIRWGLAHPDQIAPEVIRAYEAPFPDEKYKAGPAIWPLLVPLKPDDPGAAKLRKARHELYKWHKPALILFSDSDPITKDVDKFFRRLIPSARNQPQIVVEEAGHFLQEEKGEEIAQFIKTFITNT